MIKWVNKKTRKKLNCNLSLSLLYLQMGHAWPYAAD